MAARRPDGPGHASAIPPTWRLGEALARHPGLTVVPSRSADLLIEGEIQCLAIGRDDVVINERYTVTIEVPPDFPRALPRVVETAGRVPRSFHRNPDDSLCLGSPIGQLLAIEDERTIGGFLDRVLVPYFYSHAYHERFGRTPYGELAHGAAGLEDDVRRLFLLPSDTDAQEFLRLASMKRRHANKRRCPCQSGRRLGQCHRGAVHHARQRLGRSTCSEQHLFLAKQRSTQPLTQ